MKKLLCLLLVILTLAPAAAMARTEDDITMIETVVLLANLTLDDDDQGEYTIQYDQENDYVDMEIVIKTLPYRDFLTLREFGGEKFDEAVSALKESFSDGMKRSFAKMGVDDVDLVVRFLSAEKTFCFCLVNGEYSAEDVKPE